MSALDKEDIHDIFGISKKGDKSAQADQNDVYQDMMNNTDIPFDQKISTVFHPEIQKLDPNDIPTLRGPTIVVNEVSTIKINEVQVDTQQEFDSLPFDIVQTSSQVKHEDTVKVEQIIQKNIPIQDIKKNTVQAILHPQQNSNISITIDYNQWQLKSPQARFERFYSQKANLLKFILPDGKLPVKKLMKQLIDARVDVKVGVHDLQKISQRMQQSQLWRDRVKQIQLQVNYQYYKWEKAIQFLQGLLIRISEKAKNLQQRQGIFYQHIGDMELYMADLKHLHKGSEIVYKHLQSAYQCLSRQLTIALPARSVQSIGITQQTANIVQSNFINAKRNQVLRSQPIKSINKLQSQPNVGIDDLLGNFTDSQEN